MPQSKNALDEWDEATATKPLNMAEMDDLIKKSTVAWERYEAKKAEASELNKEAEAIDAKIMQALKDAGKKKYHVTGIGTMMRIEKLTVKVPAGLDQRRDFFNFLKKKGNEFFLSMVTVNSNTLNSWYNREADEAAAHRDKNSPAFSVPGIEQPTVRESLRLMKDK